MREVGQAFNSSFWSQSAMERDLVVVVEGCEERADSSVV